MRKFALSLLVALLVSGMASAADATQLFYALRSKVLSVKDYIADVKMKIDVTYMRIPQMKGTLYFKAPDKMRLERHGGLSILPKKNVNLTLGNLIPTGQVTVIDAGTTTIAGRTVRLLKVIPEDEAGNIVLAKIWVDEANLLALRTETTTRNDGTIAMDLEYARYVNYSLPDRVVMTLDMKDYKLPQGVTMDYVDEEAMKREAAKPGPKKGKIEINYISYKVNTGLSDEVFRRKAADLQ